MNKLLALREAGNLTQEELSRRSGISVRTIQRIESGQALKGYTLKALAAALGVEESAFTEMPVQQRTDVPNWIKLINLSSLVFMLLPPLNVLVPLVLIYLKKQRSALTLALLSIQIIWTLIFILLLVAVMMLHDWLGVTSVYTLPIPICWLLINGVLIIRNALELSNSDTPRMWPKINIL
jgi:transcriptional regulator with XRE-family HTH domain